MNNLNTFLGLDLGEKTLGLAISKSGIIANNLKTICFPNHKYHYLIEPLKQIIENFNVKTIVLGYPKHMNNDLGNKAKISIDFQKKIQKVFDDVEVILWDERLSTKQAFQMLLKDNNKKKKIRKLKDEVAAMIILQNFLNYRNNLINNKK